MLPYARLVSLSPEQQRSIEGLVAQVNVDNVLQVAAVLRQQADDMAAHLTTADQDLKVRRCGEDPVSKDAQALFQTKIDQILTVHWAHVREIVAACEALRGAARSYGLREEEIAATLGQPLRTR